MAPLMTAIMVLWATVAVADVNEDFLKAAERGDLSAVESLIANGADINAKLNNGKTALMLATQNGHEEIKELLIKAGAK
jgi:ankyrin repeat protein